MANNRMYLVHASGERVLLAKYYPSTGWYVKDPNLVDAAFQRVAFGTLSHGERAANASHKGLGVPYPSGEGMYGSEWKLEYEMEVQP